MTESIAEAIARREWRYYRLPNLIAIGLAIVFLFGMVWAVRSAQRAARESACHAHAYKLARAIRVYQYTHKMLPASSNGNPPHSWRILVLEELGYPELFAQYKFDEPWDSEANLKLLAEMPRIFTCPNCESTNCTSYFLHVDAAGSFSLFERNGVDIPWTKPEDIAPDAPTGPARDPGGFGIATPTDSGDPLVTFHREAK